MRFSEPVMSVSTSPAILAIEEGLRPLVIIVGIENQQMTNQRVFPEKVERIHRHFAEQLSIDDDQAQPLRAVIRQYFQVTISANVQDAETAQLVELLFD